MSRTKYEDGATSRYQQILDTFINLGINRFSWENLPLGLTQENLELRLMKKGKLLFYKKNSGGFYLLPCNGTGGFNEYGMPLKYTVYSVNGEQREIIDADKSVILKNNPSCSENITNLEIFAKRIDDTEMTQDVNLFQQNIPKIILADTDSILTGKAILEKLKSFKFVIFGKKTLSKGLGKSDILDNSSPYLLDKLDAHGEQLYNKALEYLGINNNPSSSKKERTLVDEVNSNNEIIELMLDMHYDCRQKFCDEVKEMFGYDIKVFKREVEDDTIQPNIEDDSKE